jgi:hypothetical protein
MKHYHHHRSLVAALLLAGFAIVNPVNLKADQLLERAEIVRSAHGGRHILENTDARINIEPNEKMHLDLHLSVNNGVARIEAPNGGAFNDGKKAIEVDMAKNGPAVSFDFSAGPNSGRYTIEVIHGNSTRILEFWAGQEPPRGKSGPSLTFTGDR